MWSALYQLTSPTPCLGSSFEIQVLSLYHHHHENFAAVDVFVVAVAVSASVWPADPVVVAAVAVVTSVS